MKSHIAGAAGRSEMSEVKIKVSCYRCNPKTGDKPHYQTYEVPVEPLMTIMDALDYIYENLDSTLSYHYAACRHGVCTRCMVVVNGKGMLACVALADKDMTIDPVTKDKVAKDLVVETLQPGYVTGIRTKDLPITPQRIFGVRTTTAGNTRESNVKNEDRDESTLGELLSNV